MPFLLHLAVALAAPIPLDVEARVKVDLSEAVVAAEPVDEVFRIAVPGVWCKPARGFAPGKPRCRPEPAHSSFTAPHPE